jgi:hypothetical protein
MLAPTGAHASGPGSNSAATTAAAMAAATTLQQQQQAAGAYAGAPVQQQPLQRAPQPQVPGAGGAAGAVAQSTAEAKAAHSQRMAMMTPAERQR